VKVLLPWKSNFMAMEDEAAHLLKNRHYTHNHRTTAKVFSSEEYFTLYWKEIGIGVA
jgi:hypothetical protein